MLKKENNRKRSGGRIYGSPVDKREYAYSLENSMEICFSRSLPEGKQVGAFKSYDGLKEVENAVYEARAIVTKGLRDDFDNVVDVANRLISASKIRETLYHQFLVRTLHNAIQKGTSASFISNFSKHYGQLFTAYLSTKPDRLSTSAIRHILTVAIMKVDSKDENSLQDNIALTEREIMDDQDLKTTFANAGDMTEVGEAVKQARIQANLSQSQLSLKTGLSIRTISRLETGA